MIVRFIESTYYVPSYFGQFRMYGAYIFQAYPGGPILVVRKYIRNVPGVGILRKYIMMLINVSYIRALFHNIGTSIYFTMWEIINILKN